jgi:hypothetical protein
MATPTRSLAPYLRTSRQFPDDDPQSLSVEVNKAYLDTANAVNARTIAVFPSAVQGVTGEVWYFGGLKFQGLRRIYPFTSSVNIPHGLNYGSISQFTKCSGSFTDGTNWYGAIYGSNTAIAGQVSFYVTPTNIVILAGSGAPSVVSGTIVLEWVSKT